MKALLYLSRGVLTVVGVCSVAALAVFMFVPFGAFVNAVAGLLGYDIGLAYATLATMLVTYAAGALVLVLRDGDDSGDDDSSSDPPPAPVGPSRPDAPHRLLMGVDAGLVATVRGDTAQLIGGDMAAAAAERPWSFHGKGPGETTLIDLLPCPDCVISYAWTTDDGKAVAIVARGDVAVERAMLAHHAFVVGGPLSIITSN